MTWGEWKRVIESKGVKDGDEIDYIDCREPRYAKANYYRTMVNQNGYRVNTSCTKRHRDARLEWAIW